jgi:hypothetical protein
VIQHYPLLANFIVNHLCTNPGQTQSIHCSIHSMMLMMYLIKKYQALYSKFQDDQSVLTLFPCVLDFSPKPDG